MDTEELLNDFANLTKFTELEWQAEFCGGSPEFAASTKAKCLAFSDEPAWQENWLYALMANTVLRVASLEQLDKMHSKVDPKEVRWVFGQVLIKQLPFQFDNCYSAYLLYCLAKECTVPLHSVTKTVAGKRQHVVCDGTLSDYVYQLSVLLTNSVGFLPPTNQLAAILLRGLESQAPDSKEQLLARLLKGTPEFPTSVAHPSVDGVIEEACE